MAYQQSTLGVAFGEGIDLKADKVVSAKPHTIENAEFNKAGALQKRRGYVSLRGVTTNGTTDGYITKPTGCYSKGDELLVAADGVLYSKMGSTLIDRGYLPNINLEHSQVPNPGSQYVATAYRSAAYLDGYVFIGQESEIQVYNTRTGAWSELLSITSADSLIAYGDRVIAIGNTAGAIHFSYCVPKVDPLAWSTPVAVTSSDVSATEFLSIARLMPNGYIAMAYPSAGTSGGLYIGMCTIDGTHVGGGSTLIATGHASEPEYLGMVVTSANNVYVASANSGSATTKICGIDSTLTSRGAAATLSSTDACKCRPIGYATGATSTVWLMHTEEESTSVYTYDQLQKRLVSDLTVSSSSTMVLGLMPTSDVFEYDGGYYFLAVHIPSVERFFTGSDVGGTMFLYKVGAGIVGRFCPGLSVQRDGTTLTQYQQACAVASDGEGKFWSIGYGREFANTSTVERGAANNLAPAQLVSIDFTTPVIAAEYGNGVIFTGALPRYYDGYAVNKLGHPLAPQINTLTQGSSGSLADGTYSFIAVYYCTDANGAEYFSAPSEPQTLTISAGSGTAKATLVVTNCHVDGGRTVITQIYATEASGDVYYLVASSSHAGITSSQTNSIVVTAITTTNPVLYTTGDVLENDPPPACNAITVRDSRVFVHTRNGEIWYTKPVIAGSGPEFSASAVLYSGATMGKVHALASVDGSTKLLADRGVQEFDGDGPAANGTDDRFTSVRTLSNDAGAIKATPITNSDQGAYYVGKNGVALLDRGRSIQHVGLPVEEIAKLDVKAAAKIAEDRLIVFQTADGAAYVYSYIFGQWAKWTTPLCTGPSAVVGGTHYFPGVDGKVYERSATEHLDDGKFYAMKIGTPWIKPGGQVSGYYRVHAVNIVGAFSAPHVLCVDIYYDYDDTAPGETIETPSADFQDGGKYELQIMPKRQKCSAIKFVIYDKHVLGSNDSGYSLSGLVLTVSNLGGPNRTPAVTR